jgi:protein disulfide-isomerase-like protein
LFACIAFASAQIKLKDSNFESEIKKYDLALVMFYAPWCSYSKKLAPDFKKAAKFLSSKGSKSVLIQVDCEANPDTCGNYDIPGYPTLKFFSNGQSIGNYNGQQTAFHMVKRLRELRSKIKEKTNTI